jgi:signal peptide peptidase SppA
MQFAFLAQRLFNVPLAIAPGKAEIIIAALSDRLGITQIERLNPHVMEDDDIYFTAQGNNPRKGYDVVGGVALIEISGTLVQKLGSLYPWSGMTGYDGIRQNIVTALGDPEVKAICLMIDSPGGEVAGCFDLIDAIFSARGRKPIWSILNEKAYSGAYAIASATDKIIVPRTGGVGSIGVIWMHYDFSKAIDSAGIKVTIVQYGATKADGHQEIPLSGDALARFQGDIDYMGELFVNTVARNRGMSADAVRNTQALTYLGQAGVEIGLADAVMAPDAAFAALLAEIND